MRWIYLSPHLDDAVLSAGGLIYDQSREGKEVEIWTIMCGFPASEDVSPFAQLLHQRWGMTSAEQVVRVRRAEDGQATGLVGATPVHFDFLDCIYRRGSGGNWLYTDIFLPPHEEEFKLPQSIADTLAQRLRSEDQLVCQLGIGSHVDHVLVRQGAEKLRRPLIYLADIPYIFKYQVELDEKAKGLEVAYWPVSEEGLKVWKDAVEIYSSQKGSLQDLMDGDDPLERRIDRYWSDHRRTIRTWSVL